MNSFFFHLIQSSVVFIVFYIGYRLVLSRLTFHQLNRWILLFFIPISILIPLVENLLPIVPREMVELPIFEGFTYETTTALNPAATASVQTDYSELIIWTYCMGVLICLIRIVSSILKLVVLKNRSLVTKKENYKLVITKDSEIYSYFNWIFVPEHRMRNCDALILAHEKAHIKLKHSIDLLVTEIYFAFFWFNPIVYFYRKSLKSIHEFQADKSALRHEKVKISYYMELLLDNIKANNTTHICSYFKQPIIKKRIEMMLKTKSNPLLKIKYLIFIPIGFFCLVSFTKTKININNRLDVLQAVVSTPSLFPIQNVTKEDITSPYGAQRKDAQGKRGQRHKGIDFKAEIGTPVIATTDGVITNASNQGNWGNLVIISHANGYETGYAHLSNFNCKKDQVVKKGQIIGYTGNSGLSSGPHLHYMIKHHGSYVDPINYLE